MTKQLFPMIVVQDPGQAARWYRERLGFEAVASLGWYEHLRDAGGHELGFLAAGMDGQPDALRTASTGERVRPLVRGERPGGLLGGLGLPGGRAPEACPGGMGPVPLRGPGRGGGGSRPDPGRSGNGSGGRREVKAPNIGPTILRRLHDLGVRSVDDIRRLGPGAIYRSLAAANPGRRLPCATICTASRPPSRGGTGGA